MFEEDGHFILDKATFEHLAMLAEGWALAHWDVPNAEPVRVLGTAAAMLTLLKDMKGVERCAQEATKIAGLRAGLKEKAERKSRPWFGR